MAEKEFTTANELEAWLIGEQHVNSTYAKKAAPVLFREDYIVPSSFEGISYERLKELKISDAVARSLSKQLQLQELHSYSSGPPAKGERVLPLLWLPTRRRRCVN
jgi:hypothetical protein